MTAAFADRLAKFKPTKIPVGYSISELEQDVLLLSDAFKYNPMPSGYIFEVADSAIKNGEPIEPTWLAFHQKFWLNRRYLTTEFRDRLELWIACYKGEDWCSEDMEYEIDDIDPNHKRKDYVLSFRYGSGDSYSCLSYGGDDTTDTYGATEDDMDNPSFWINL